MNNSNLPQRKEFYQEELIATYVVKVASRCNLNCTYCYMYEHADQSWRNQPTQMSVDTMQLLAKRLGEYARHRDLKRLLIVAHGGEPLLLGASGLRSFYSQIKEELAGVGATVQFGLQTNGVLVDDDIVKVLQDFGIRAGVSIDGPQEWNDKARKDHQGFGSFERVLAGVERLRNPKEGTSVFGGFLTVLSPEISPRELFAFYKEIEAPAFEFLLPQYNHDTFPYDKYPIGTFGRWLVEAFDLWIDSGQNVEIRFFSMLMKLLLGGQGGYDAVGEMSKGVLVVETDGTYHGVDVLKTTYHGATTTGKSLLSHPISALEAEPLVMSMSNKRFSVNQKCLDCRFFRACGGGYLPHRYSSASGFDRESVYCNDLMMIIGHIEQRLSDELVKVV